MAMGQFDPESFFGQGTAANKNYSGNPWTLSPGQSLDRFGGSGMRGLPATFRGWKGPARYGVGVGANYVQQTQPVADYYRGEMDKDYQGTLYGMSSDALSRTLSDSSKMQQQAFARSGSGGGAGISPFAALTLQTESQARAGALGEAARQSVLLAQQMRSQAATNYARILDSQRSAMMEPAYIQAGVNPSGNPYDEPSLGGQFVSGLSGNIASAGMSLAQGNPWGALLAGLR